jgi:transcriptional regulator with XRE-family HTH domain
MRQTKSLMMPAQCRAARSLLGWNQPRLAKAAGVGRSTVTDFELQSREVSVESVAKMQAALEAAGVQFTNGKRPGVRLAR